MNNKELARRIALGIFASGNQGKELVQRIQFMAGSYPDAERPLGGLGLPSLTSVIFRILETGD